MDRTETSMASELRPLSELAETDVWAMVDASPDGMLLADEHGAILFVNNKIETMFDYDRGDLLGQSVEVLLPERCRQVHTAHRTRYRAQPTSRAMGTGLELLARRAGGTEFPVEVSLSPVATDDGLRVVATVRDISQRLEVEAHTHAVLHTIDEAHDGVFMFTPDTLQFSYVNQGAVNQLGYTSDELLAMTPIHIKPEFTEATFREMLAPLLADAADSYSFTTVHRRKDGTDTPVEIIVEYPPPPGPDRPRLLVALVRDISQRLKNEQAIQDQQAQLQVLEDRERLARDLHDLVIQRLFAAGMGLQSVHHLATDAKLASRITETVDQLDETIAELRATIFHLTTGPVPVTTQLGDCIDQASTALSFQPSLDVVGDLESTSPALVDELLPTLTEALSNIARHAKATRADIRVEVTDETLTVTITDDGTGIDPDAPRGHGLGNIESRARQLGGTTSISSGTSGGTTLTWTAPLSG